MTYFHRLFRTIDGVLAEPFFTPHEGNMNMHANQAYEGLVFGCDHRDNKSTSNGRVATQEMSQHEGIR